MDCIFCKIAAGEIPSTVEYETDELIVIRDLSPQAPLHLLIIPKKHYTTLMDCDGDTLPGVMLQAAIDVAKKKHIDERGFRTVINTNKEGGQVVMHLHMHILAGEPLGASMC